MGLAAFYNSKADYLQAGKETKSPDDRKLMTLFSTAQADPGWADKLKGAFEPRGEKPPGTT